MNNILFWIMFLPIRLFQYILAFYFQLRGYKYVEVEPNVFVWMK